MNEQERVELIVPADQEAEEVVVGCAVSNRHGAVMAAVHGVAPANFYWPAHARLFEAATAIPDIVDQADRIASCAARADVPEAQVGALLARRGVMWDREGSYAARVIDAARRRRVAHLAEAASRRLLEGGSLDEALSLLRAAS